MHRGFQARAFLSASALLVFLVSLSARAISAGQAASAAEQQAQQQQPTSSQSAAPAAPLRVTTRLVQINVIVNDKHGSPIIGLTKNDFFLLDNKRAQEIQFFSADADLPPNQPPITLPPDTYTNRLADHSAAAANVTVILLDALNTESADQALARKQVVKFLEHLRLHDRVALYWLGSGLYVLNDFTTDVAVLRHTLASYEGESSRELANSQEVDPRENNPNSSLPQGVDSAAASTRQAFRSAFEQRVKNTATKNRVHLTVAALIAIAHHLNGLQGRKNLVWVSASFPLTLGQDRFDLNWLNDTGENFKGEIARAAQALTDANVAVYPVDARGILGSGLTAAADYADAPPPEFSGEGDEHLPSRLAPGNLDTMKVLAERTGGRAFYGTNDLSGAIRRAMDDARVTYTLGYYPADTKWDGTFHSIKVKVRTPGAEVRARTGYFAIRDSSKASPKSIQALISQTAISQLDATGIGIRVEVHATELSSPEVQSAMAEGNHAVAIELHVDLHDLHLEQNNGYWTGALQTVFLQLNNRGEIIHASDETLHLSLPPSVYELAQKEGLKNSRQIQVQPGATQLCMVLRDPINGNLGSLSIPLGKYLPGLPQSHH